MEGYFPVSTYAKLSGISYDTAIHRCLRGSIDCFRRDDGRWFAYYNKSDISVPEGFISLSDYCIMTGIKKSRIWYCIKKGHIPYSAYKTIPWGRTSRIYIDPNWRPKQSLHTCTHTYISLRQSRPSGYLTVKEWSAKVEMNYRTARAYVNRKIIPVIIVDGHYYINNETPIPEYCKTIMKRIRNKNMLLNESA